MTAIHLPGKTIAECAAAYTKMGLALVEIPAGTKVPVRDGWNKPGGYVTSPEVARKTWGRGQNMGAVLGPSGIATLDLDNLDHARTALTAIGINLDVLLDDESAVSLIGNPDNHAKLVFRVPVGSELKHKKLTWSSKEKANEKDCIFELRAGGGVQDILPPSVHPDTKQPYRWGRSFWSNGGIPPLADVLEYLWTHWEEYLPKMEAACPWAPPVGTPVERKTTKAVTIGSFDDFAREHGLVVPAGGWIADGEFHRCDAHGPDGVVGRNDGTYKLHGDFPENGLLWNWHRHTTGQPWKPHTTAESPKPDLVPVQPQVRTQDFPAHAMTGAAADFAHLYSSYMEVPKEFLFMSYLTCLGLHLADSLTIDSELRQQPRLFTLLLGESADDRKSTAISKTVAFFKESCFAFTACWGVGSGEGLQKKMGTSNKLLLAFDEFVQFVGKCRIDGSILLVCVNSLFENNWYEGHTKTASVVLENAYLSMLAASTTQTYEKVWDPKFIDLGFVNRVWLVTGKGGRKFSCPRSIPSDSMLLAKKKLSAVLEFAEKHPVMEMTEEARERYHQWYMTRERTIYSKRLDTYALRFMPLLAVNDLKADIDVETVEKVIAMCDHQHFLRQTYDPIDAENNTARLEEKIRRALRSKGPLGKRGLQKAIHAERDGIFFFTQALSNLMSNNEVGVTKEGDYFLGVDVSPKVSPPEKGG